MENKVVKCEACGEHTVYVIKNDREHTLILKCTNYHCQVMRVFYLRTQNEAVQLLLDDRLP